MAKAPERHISKCSAEKRKLKSKKLILLLFQCKDKAHRTAKSVVVCAKYLYRKSSRLHGTGLQITQLPVLTSHRLLIWILDKRRE